MANATTFEAGKTYRTRSIGDADMWISIAVISRTAKSLRIRDDRGERTLRIAQHYTGIECVKPWGSYSMAPIITPDKVA